MKIKPLNNIGQHITEYTLLIILVTAGVLVMGPYLKRSWNGQMRGWEVSVKDTMQDPLKEAAPFSNIPCHCEYSSGTCTYVVGHERQIQKDLICNPVGCETTLDPVPQMVIYEYAPAGSERCCTQEITPNTCGVLANLPPAGNGHMSGGCVSEHLEIKKTCDDESIASNTTYHCSVNGEPDYVESGISAGTNLCNADGTHGDCLNNCLNSDGDPITDPNDPTYNNARYDGFCTDDIENAPPNTYISYVNNSSGCTAQKCEVKCKLPFVLRNGNCFCPSPWATLNNAEGQPIGCQCPGETATQPDMAIGRPQPYQDGVCMGPKSYRKTIFRDKNLPQWAAGGVPALRTACDNLNSSPKRRICSSDGNSYNPTSFCTVPWGSPNFDSNSYATSSAESPGTGITTACHPMISADGSLWDLSCGFTQEYCGSYGCQWVTNMECSCLSLSSSSLTGQEVIWEGGQPYSWWAGYTPPPNPYNLGIFNLNPPARNIESYSQLGPVAFPNRGSFREMTSFHYATSGGSSFDSTDECPIGVTPPCIPSWWLYSGANPYSDVSYPQGAMCPEGYAMKGIRTWNGYCTIQGCDEDYGGDNLWYIACSEAQEKADGSSCLISNDIVLQGPFYGDSEDTWVGVDCPDEYVMVGMKAQMFKSGSPTGVGGNAVSSSGWSIDNAAGKTYWWAICQRVDESCFHYVPGRTFEQYFYADAANKALQSVTAPKCSFVRGIWTYNNGNPGHNHWSIKYIR